MKKNDKLQSDENGIEQKGKNWAMYRILLCDDDAAFLKIMQQQIETFFDNIGEKVKLHSYSYPEEISDYMLKSCDIAFFDIDFMDHVYNGLDLAKHLRQLKADSIIIFITNYVEYAPEGYEVQAFRYMLKREFSTKISKYLQEAVHHLEISRSTEKIQINGELIDIPIHEILYFEAQLHEVVVYLQSTDPKATIKNYRFYSTLSKIEEKMGPKGFLRIHKSYLVNYDRIKRYQCREVELDNGQKLSASVNRYSEQKQKFLQYKGARLNG